MKKLLEQKPLFIFLVPAFYLFHLLVDYFRVLSWRDLINIHVLLLGGIPLLVFLAALALPPAKRKYCLLILFVEDFYFFFGAIQEALSLLSGFFSSYHFLLPASIVVLLLLGYFIWRQPVRFAKYFYQLNILMLVLIGVDLLFFVALHSTDGKIKVWLSGKTKVEKLYRPFPPGPRPDIYYIIFDGHASDTALRKFWSYHNNRLDSTLKARGFRVLEQSRSNYNSTPFSISSELNMDFISGADKIRKLNTFYFLKAMRSIESNSVCTILSQEGYRLYDFSFFPFALSERKVQAFEIADPAEIILAQTFWYRFTRDIGWNFGWGQGAGTFEMSDSFMQQFMQHELDRIVQTRTEVHRLIAADSQPAPKFVYAHFLLPHDPFPYFYDSTGGLYSPDRWRLLPPDKNRYLEQLVYSNRMIEELISDIFRRSDRSPIIILQGDHGYRSFDKEISPDWAFSNLSAFYFPDRNYKLLYDSMSNVNSFRVVLDQYFQQTFPLLKDASVYIR